MSKVAGGDVGANTVARELGSDLVGLVGQAGVGMELGPPGGDVPESGRVGKDDMMCVGLAEVWGAMGVGERSESGAPTEEWMAVVRVLSGVFVSRE